MPTYRPVTPSRNSQKTAGNTASPTAGSGPVTERTRPPRTAAARANADVPPNTADPQQRSHPAKHHFNDGEPGLAAAFTPQPTAAADRVASWPWFATAEPTGQPR